MIYLNNAASTYPKPPVMISAMTEALRREPLSSLRSTLSSERPIEDLLRSELAELLHCTHSENIHFTSGATDALNRLIGGLTPMRVALTSDNHNSVLRPVYNNEGIKEHVLLDDPFELEHLSGIDWLILPHCSNVTGHIHNIAEICWMAHNKGTKVMVDAAQSLGTEPFEVDKWNVDAVAFTGHKALFGPQGTGGYYIRPGIRLRPTQYGGTGRDSNIVEYGEKDWEYEVGTHNGPGLAGMAAGVKYVLDRGVEAISASLRSETNWLIGELSQLPKVSCYSKLGDNQGPVVSFNIHGLQPSDVGYILQNTYGITVRTGLHCAPFCHRKLGTQPFGTVRISLSIFNTHDELEQLINSLLEIIAAV